MEDSEDLTDPVTAWMWKAVCIPGLGNIFHEPIRISRLQDCILPTPEQQDGLLDIFHPGGHTVPATLHERYVSVRPTCPKAILDKAPQQESALLMSAR